MTVSGRVRGRKSDSSFNKLNPQTSKDNWNLQSDDLRDLCARIGVNGSVRIDPLPGGRNNRVYCLASNSQKLLLKVYFRHRDDPRDRLKHEFGFLEYLWSRGLRCVPQPVWADYNLNVGVYSFIPGRKLRLEEIGPTHVEQTVQFYRDINHERRNPEAGRLPVASEAGFSIGEHLRNVAHRVERLKIICQDSKVSRSAHGFARGELVPLWDHVRAGVSSEYERKGLVNAELSQEMRCLSPSDFGFHNTLVDEEGTVRFLDFEYAGWDDPAKLVCDFASQPDMALPEEMSDRFRAAVVGDSAAPEQLLQRIVWLTPVYQIKWSCIILNVFLPYGSERTLFVRVALDQDAIKREQLEKARQMLKRAGASYAAACAL